METIILKEFIDKMYSQFEYNILKLIDSFIGSFVFQDHLCLDLSITNNNQTVTLIDGYSTITSMYPMFSNVVNTVKVSFNDIDSMTAFGIVGIDSDDIIQYKVLYNFNWKCITEWNEYNNEHNRDVIPYSIDNDVFMQCKFDSINDTIDYYFDNSHIQYMLQCKPDESLTYTFGIELGCTVWCTVDNTFD